MPAHRPGRGTDRSRWVGAPRGSGVRPLGLVIALVLTLTLGLTTPARADRHNLKRPTGLSVTSRDNASLEASWTAVKGAEHYKVQYATSPDFDDGVYTWTDATRIRVEGLAPATTYWVKVRVVDPGNLALSDYSHVEKVTSGAASDGPVPAHLTVVASNSSTVSLSWDEVTPGAHYRVAYGPDRALADPTRVAVATNSVLVDRLKGGSTYWFAVQQTDADDLGGSRYSSPLKVKTSGASVIIPNLPVQVASYNVRCANCSKGGLVNEERPWPERKAAVVALIKSRDLDVVGIQEASQGWLRGSSGGAYEKSQFEDLAEGLGAPWALTNTARNNCVKSTTPNNCRYADQGASQGTKIIYNTARLKLIRSGSRLLSAASSSTNARYVAWAILQQKDTKARFFFADTHLDHEDDGRGSSTYYTLRKAQAAEVIAEVARQNTDHLPTVVVGDLNSSQYTRPSNAPYDEFRAAGYRAPLGNLYRSTEAAPDAPVEKRINTNLDSFNDFERRVRSKAGINGNYIDYIMTTPMRVSEWETVVNADNGRFNGIIPSDHNLIRATLWLPRT